MNGDLTIRPYTIGATQGLEVLERSRKRDVPIAAASFAFLDALLRNPLPDDCDFHLRLMVTRRREMLEEA